MTAATQVTQVHELVDVVDIQPMPGEYVGCRHPFEPIEVFGITVHAWHTIHAQRIAVNKLWNSTCECCNHALRYCHVTQDETGKYHCFGGKCLANITMGTESANKLEYSRKVEEKESGFCATFDVPQKFWDTPREQRPPFARVWKGKAFTRKQRRQGGAYTWKLSVWGGSFEECLENCVVLAKTLGIKLI